MKRSILLFLSVAALALMLFKPLHAAPGPAENTAQRQHDQEPEPAPRTLGTGHAHCQSGLAAGFACNGIDQKARLPISQLGGQRGSDLWAWVEPESGREFALFTASNGTFFVEVTDPENPIRRGHLPATTGPDQPWRDVKTYGHHAYVVADGVPGHGVQVFDLNRMLDGNAASVYEADFVYDGISDAHNIAVNEATGFAYPVGDRSVCSGGIVFLDLSDPAEPAAAGCYSGDGYTHDVQCAVYTGPDPDYQNRELCIGSNEDTVTLVDVTDKTSPRLISRVAHPNVGYVHQGWLTGDQRYFLLGDELDEIEFGNNTRTLIYDLEDLDAPRFVDEYVAPTTSIDHNLYIRDNLAYMANYTSGLRVVSLQDIARGELREVAYFDTAAEADGFTFSGAWSAYPFLPSGNLLVADREQGLFVLAASGHGSDDGKPSLDGRFSGHWFVEEQDAQGATIIVGVNDDGPYIFMVWFTYLGGEPFWIVAQGSFATGDDHATLQTFRLSGLDFFDAVGVAERSEIGEIEISITDCDELDVSYALGELGSGQVQMQRLASVEGRGCDAAGSGHH